MTLRSLLSTTHQLRPKKGFTLIELLVTMAISGLLLGFGFSAYTKTQNRQSLHNSAKKVETILRSIQKRAIIGDNDCQGYFQYYQVTINPNQNTITSQAVCHSSHGNSKTYTISGITFTNGCILHFQPLQQGLVITSPLSSTFNLTLSLNANPNLTKTITIAKPGLILVND